MIDAVVAAVRDACGVPVGVSTGAWIEPDLGRRLELIAGWSAPDYASVNLSEAGAADVMRRCSSAGVGIEAGVWSVEDAERLAACGLGDRVTRILVEPVDVAAGRRRSAIVDEIHAALDRLGLTAPRLQHGDGEATWVLLRDAVRRGIDTRIGLEDTVAGPDGARADGNEALVRAARDLGAGSLIVVDRGAGAPACAATGAAWRRRAGPWSPPSAWSRGARAAPRAHGSGARAGAPVRARDCAPGCGHPAPRRARPGRSGP